MRVKKIVYPLICILLLSSGIVSAQPAAFQEKVEIQWLGLINIPDTLGGQLKVMHSNLSLPLPQDNRLPYIVLRCNGHYEDLELVETNYTALSTSELEAVQTKLSSARLKKTVQHGWEKKQPVTFFQLPALSQSGGAWKKLSSFTWKPSSPKAVEQVRAQRRSSTTTSILASGDIYRIGVTREGVYKIDAAFLSAMGVNVSSLDPRTVKLYGNPGGMLPQENAAFRYDDLPEQALYAFGESDGVMNAQDYFLFYSRGPHYFSYDNSIGQFKSNRNIYTDTSYLMIKIGGNQGKRLSNFTSFPTQATIYTQFDDRYIHEQDLFNPMVSGRNWVGESFNFTPSRSYSFNIPGIANNSTIRITSTVAGRSPAAFGTFSTFNLQLGSTPLGVQSLPAIGDIDYGIKFRVQSNTYQVNSSLLNGNSNLVFTYTFNKGPSFNAEGYLDHLLLNVKRNLALYGNWTSFRVPESTIFNTVTYRLSNFDSLCMIWDVSDPTQVVNILYNLNGGGIGEFSVETDTLKEYLVLKGSNFPNPSYINKVANQNLHGMTAPDLLVVTFPGFKTQAQSYANHRTLKSNITAEVVTTHDIYQEFSSGGQDLIGIRDFIKFLYDQPNSKLKYVLLFGDASYDYKNRISGNTNFVPIYQSYETNNNLSTYCSDDFYAFMDQNEGNWNEFGFLVPHTMDLAVGRISVRSNEEAANFLNKAQVYESMASLGNWRNRYLFLADHKATDGHFHLDENERFVNILEKKDSAAVPLKVYLDQYDRISTANGVNAPNAVTDINNYVHQGALVSQYYGHGNIAQLSAAQMITKDMVNTWTNINRLSFWVTATCDFGRMDDPSITSGGEVMFLKSNGGAIGLLTTNRPVTTNVNSILVERFIERAYDFSTKIYTLGEITAYSKNSSLNATGVGGRNVILLGDPSMKLAYPVESMEITNIRRLPTMVATDTLKALAVMEIKGKVLNRQNRQLINSFNGTANIVIYDAPSQVTTQGIGVFIPNSTTVIQRRFNQWKNFVFNGQASIVNGEFSVQFIVPLQISYSNLAGRINLYGRQTNSTTDANGFRSNIIISGSDTGIVLDNNPPQIRLYMDDESFTSGSTTSQNPKMIAVLTDDQGISVSSAPGQQIEATMNRKEPQVLNEYYISKENNFREGKVEYPYQNLSPGNYSLKLRARDTHNNPGEATIEFVVANDEKLVLNNIFNYPNPFSDFTSFQFDHNQAGKDLDVKVEVFTVSGRLIKTLIGYFPASKTRVSDLNWNARDEFGDKLAKGVYIYKLSVRTSQEKKEEFQKLVILN
jgi:hypothetical protein